MYFRRTGVSTVLVRFLKDERGDITTFLLPTFILLIFTTGLGIDLIRHEANRADLQNALDRGVLAAASCVQEDDLQTVVRNYVKTRTFNEVEANVEFDIENTIVTGTAAGGDQSCSAVAGASFTYGTTFLNLIGQPTLQVNAVAAAREGTSQSVGQNEISLVLDISASMARERTVGSDGVTDTRLEVLKDAAAKFVNDNIGGAGQSGTSLTLVPYSGQVNVGRFSAAEADPGGTDPDSILGDGGGGDTDGLAGETRDDSLFTRFTGGNRVHDFSSCIEFDDDDFDTLALPVPGASAQVPHFQNFYFEDLRGQSFPYVDGDGNDTEWGWCPTDDQAMVPFSNSPSDLTSVINGFHGHDGTGIQNGLKWGLGMLMPSSQSLISELVTNNHVSSNFAGRPASFGTTNKILILMTDGRVRYQNRPRPEEYETEEQRARFEFDEERLAGASVGLVATNTLLSTNPDNFMQLSTLDTNTKRNTDEAKRRDQVRDLCNLANATGYIRIYTIAFGFKEDDPLANDARTLLQDCATNPSDFSDVSNGVQLDAVFNQITTQIQDLRLFR
jgi:hypothetical protein